MPAVKIGIETTTTIPSFTSTEKETEISTVLPEIPAVQVEFETTTTTKPSTESLATTLVSTDKEQPTISTLKPEKTKPTISEIGIDTTSAPEISKTTEIPSTTTLLPDISKIQTTTTTRPTTLETITGEPIVDYITTTRRPITMVNESATVIYPPTSLEPIIEDHSTIVPYPPIDGDHTIIIELPSNKTDMAQIETTTAFMDHHPELSTVVTTDSSLIIEDHSTIKPISPTEFVPIEMNKTEPSEKGLIHLTSTLSPEDNETMIPIVGESALTTKLPDTSLMINVTTPQPELSKSTKSMITIEPDTSEPESATKPLIISSEEPEEEVWTDTPTVIVTVPTINENVTIISESKHEISTTKLPFYPVTTGTQQQQQQEEEEEQIEQEEEPDETIAPRPVTPKPGVKTKLKKPTQQQQRPDDGVKKPSYRPSSSSFTPFTDLGDGSCVYDGKIFQSAEQIPRPHPCDFCFCFRGDIICLQQTCPPPIKNCMETHIEGFCCPRYECPVDATTMNMTIFHNNNKRMARSYNSAISSLSYKSTTSSTTTTTTTTTIRPPPYSISIIEKKGCRVNGIFYEIGKRIDKSSNACLDCRCDPMGLMRCDPLDCSSSFAPLLLRMNRNYFLHKK